VSWLLVALGGALGSLARYGVAMACARWLPATFPYGTFAVNAVGCAIFGLLLGLGESRQLLTPAIRAFCLVGVLGGFTTFSAYSAETLALLRAGAWLPALVNAAGQVVVGIGAVALGWWAGRALG
jgi:fluoride exporter